MASVVSSDDGDQSHSIAAAWRRRRRRRLLAVAAAVPLLLLLWLLITAPLSRSLEPQNVSSLLLLSADGQPIARHGAIVDAPVRFSELPPHVVQAFVAIEDRRFATHWGVDPRGLLRATWHNLRAGSMREGGSTITQQLAKQSFLSSSRSLGRKLREMLLAVWLEANLSKREILERYLSTAYFGDNVYGLRAAARHYFSKDPGQLDLAEGAMLAGLMKAPTRLAPTRNPFGARERARLVLGAMADARFISRETAGRTQPAQLDVEDARMVPGGGWFADWILASRADPAGREQIRTTLDSHLQRIAAHTIARAPLGQAEVALIAMRPNGAVVAMVGGRNYARSGYNRATQAQRQPGSTFKLFVYLTALREGLTPDSPILDAPVSIDGWSPANADGSYRGEISLRDAFTVSSNVAAVRLGEIVGRNAVVRTARDLGISTPLAADPSLALGTHATTLLEMTGAYAAVAGNAYPVRPFGRAEERWASFPQRPLLDRATLPMMLDLLWSSANVGTGRAAGLRTPTFGKTGTSQDSRDAVFIGFAQDLVVGVWIGRDDNRPIGGMAGGGLPARVWRDFMSEALGTARAGWSQAAALEGAPERVSAEPVPQRRLVSYRIHGRGHRHRHGRKHHRWRR